MPSAQVINLNAPEGKPTPIERTAESFSQRFMENKERQRESDALKEIYGKYQNDEQMIQKSLMDIQTSVELSPTDKVNNANQLLQMQRYNLELQKKASRDIKAKEKQEFDQAERDRVDKELEASGATEKQRALARATTTGGQTEVAKHILDTQSKNERPAYIPEGIRDFDSGLTAKQRVARQDQRFSIQTPMVNKNSDRVRSLEGEGRSIDLLSELTGKVGQGISNLNINPKTGDLIIPKAASAEEALYVKTINDFTVKAKDSFGANVTNFELDRFMQRLPTLANSEEGRALILKQMQTINKINQLEAIAIQDVFDEYGVRNIDYADAENIARNKISEEKNLLTKQYSKLENQAKIEDKAVTSHLLTRVKEGYTAMRSPSGEIKQYPNKNVQNLEVKGYKKL